MKLLSFNLALVLQHFSFKKLKQSQQYNIVICLTKSAETTVIYIDFKDNLKVILTSVNTFQVQQLIKQAIKEMISSQILQKMSKAAI